MAIIINKFRLLNCKFLEHKKHKILKLKHDLKKVKGKMIARKINFPDVREKSLAGPDPHVILKDGKVHVSNVWPQQMNMMDFTLCDVTRLQLY